MNWKIMFNIVLVVVLVGVFIGLGALAYNTGVRQGILVGAQAPAGEQAAQVPYALVPYRMPFYGYPGFGFFPCLAGLFLFFLFFFALRGLFWHGHYGRHYRGMYGPWWGDPGNSDPGSGKSVPPPFTEWHRRMHESQPEQTEAK